MRCINNLICAQNFDFIYSYFSLFVITGENKTFLPTSTSKILDIKEREFEFNSLHPTASSNYLKLPEEE